MKQFLLKFTRVLHNDGVKNLQTSMKYVEQQEKAMGIDIMMCKGSETWQRRNDKHKESRLGLQILLNNHRYFFFC